MQVERVVFLGLPAKGSYRAKLPNGQVVPLEQGWTSFAVPLATSAHVLRKPQLAVTDDWVVEILG